MNRPAETAARALAELTEAYRSNRQSGDVAGPIIGTVGADVPLEVIAAAGAVPIRLRGEPGADMGRGDHYLGTGLDPATRSLLTLLLDGAFGDLDGIVVSSDCDASLRLFYVLREIARVEPGTPLPPVELVDMLHLPRPTTTAYNAVRMRQFVARIQAITGSAITDSSLAVAIAEHDELRRLQRRVSALRHIRPARLSGSQFLAVIGAATRLPFARYRALLIGMLDGARALPSHDGTRVFLTGSSHDTDAVYTAIESRDAVVVGEDHDWGELSAEREVGAPTLDALAERYQYNGPSAQRSSIRQRAAYTAFASERASADVVLSYTRERDDAPLWDFTAQRDAVRLPAAIISRQPYGIITDSELDETLRSFQRLEEAV